MIYAPDALERREVIVMDAVEKTEKENGSRQQGDTLNEIVEKAVKKAFAEMRAEEKRERQKRAFHETKKLMESYTELKRYVQVNANDEAMDTLLVVMNIDRAMQELKEQSRKKGIGYKFDAFEMHYIQHMAYEDIADALNCGKNSPANWSKQVMRKLSIKLFGAKAV